ncbi:hypothetical protein KO361_00430 [Candidatus Woesearchaeota archaeon]|nr:hypothetical protein [Candidatus Woesearchaeota archaeon]
MSFLENVKDSLRAIIFDDKAISKLANSNSATGFGFLTLALCWCGYGDFCFECYGFDFYAYNFDN